MNKEQRHRQQSASRQSHEIAVAKWDARRDDIVGSYFELGWTLQRIGDVYGVCAPTIGNQMRRWGVDLSKLAHAGHRNSRYKDGSRMMPYRQMIDKDICNRCDSLEKLCIHHINNDYFDNRLCNLEVLCLSCHMSHHKTEYWKAIRAGTKPPVSTRPHHWHKQKSKATA